MTQGPRLNQKYHLKEKTF